MYEHLTKYPLIVFSTQFWGDLWVSKHWISSEVSKYTKVVYVNPVSRLFYDRSHKAGHLLTPKIKSLSETLFSFYPLGFPFRYKAYIPLGITSNMLTFIQLRSALKKLGINEYSVLTFDPRSLYWIERLHPKKTVYYCVDPVYGEEDPWYPEKKLVEAADKVIAVSQPLKDTLENDTKRKDIEIIEHAMDVEGVLREVPNVTEPDDLPECNGVRIGYVGSVHNIYINAELIRQTAQKHPEWQFVFVGSYKPTEIATGADAKFLSYLDLPNIYLLGKRPFHVVKRYIKFFDVCIAPYNLKNDSNWHKRSPFKLLHYLSQGKPTVVARVPALSLFKDHVYPYENEEEFESTIIKALRLRNDNGLREKRIAFAKKYDFSKALTRLDKVFRSCAE